MLQILQNLEQRLESQKFEFIFDGYGCLGQHWEARRDQEQQQQIMQQQMGNNNVHQSHNDNFRAVGHIYHGHKPVESPYVPPELPRNHFETPQREQQDSFVGGYQNRHTGTRLHLHGRDEDHITHGHFKDRFNDPVPNSNLNGFQASMASSYADEDDDWDQYDRGSAVDRIMKPLSTRNDNYDDDY